MRYIHLLLIAVLTGLAGCAGYQPSEGVREKAADPVPVEIKFLKRRHVIADYKYKDYYFDLKITNHYSSPMWFVIRHIGNEPLREDAMFHGKKLGKQPFAGWVFDGARTGGKGKVVKIDHLGRHKFTAFHLPAKGTVHFARYHMVSPLNFHEFDVWVAPTILVNAKTPLRRWLPYKTLSDAEVVLSKDAKGKSLDWNPERMGSRQDYPKEKVKMVWVEAKRKYKLDLDY